MNKNFLEWFVGFVDAEGCFKIKPKFRLDKTIVHSFYFEFEIKLHIDDKAVLDYICATLGIGKVYVRGNTCSWIVGNEQGIRILLDIFRSFPLNGVKHLDFIDFSRAFDLYFNRVGTLSLDLINLILGLKNGMNTGRTNFSMPTNHSPNITANWLLGFIEGDGSFSFNRNPFSPRFNITLTASQKFLLLSIKNFLIHNLCLGFYSRWFLNNTSVIRISDRKAKGGANATVSLDILNLGFLYYIFIPFLAQLHFFSAKQSDFLNFSLITRLLFTGATKSQEILELVIKLTFSMNSYRLSTYKGNDKQELTEEEISKLENAPPLLEYHPNGRIFDKVTGKFYFNAKNKLFSLTKAGEKEILVTSLSEASAILGVNSSLLSRLLEKSCGDSFVYNGYTIKRVDVFA